MESFKNFFSRIVNENMTAGGGGVFGNTPDQPAGSTSSDWYAPGDSRIPKVLGAKKKKKMAIQRRNLKSS